MAPTDLSINVTRNESSPSSPRARRSQSISSDRPSTTGYGGLLSPPPNTSPDPAFIAASAASQIVTNDHDSQNEMWFDQHGIEPSGETALVAVPALKLVNRFLDQLLFNFLSIARSTSLASLRPAVAEVLKPKLAKGAISGADQELHEYLGGGEDEELLSFHNGQEPSGDWDLELVWKRTRLRCMVYSSLGDMEEEDEDFYTEQEQLDGPPGANNRFSNNPGVVSPAVAIFLTAVLEFMGEQVLVVAGQAAYFRLRAKHEKEEREGTSIVGDIADRVVVEEGDMERVALDRTLGRLWRGWKKRIRSPTASISMGRSFSRESQNSPVHGRSASLSPDTLAEQDSVHEASLATVLAEHEHAALIPLPSNENDIREIEIPGLAAQSDDEDDDMSDVDEPLEQPTRPKSLVIFDSAWKYLPTPPPEGPIFTSPSRKRSHSLPPPAASLYKTAKRSKPSPEEDGAEKPEEEQIEEQKEEQNEQKGEEEKGEEKAEGNGDETAVAHIDPSEEKISGIPEGTEVAQQHKIDAKDETVADKGLVAEGSEVTEKPEIQAKDEPVANKGLVAGVVAGAVAIGAAAVAGVVAAAHGETLQTAVASKDEAASDSEVDLAEEPEILTSSRISISSGKSPEDASFPSRRSSIRSPSVHSVRLVEVSSPKDGVTRSRPGSVGYFEVAPSGSRPTSIHSPVLVDSHSPRVASPVLRSSSNSPLARNVSGVSARHSRNSAEESISEVEEQDVNEKSEEPVNGVATDVATAMQGVDVESGPPPALSPRSAHRDIAKEVAAAAVPAAFVLGAVPAVRAARARPNQSPDRQVPQANSNLTIGGYKGPDAGVPPLTPLREMMEGAPDTSDEASSIAPSDGHSLHERGINGHSPSASSSSLYNRRGGPHQPQAVRSSPPRHSREESARRGEKRQTHTSGSSSSSTSHKLKPVRTSEDSGPKGIEDKGQSFEQLIRSDQTIQYTLTPQNMRDIEAPDSPRHVVVNVYDGPRPTTSRSHSSSKSKTAISVSKPIIEVPKSPKATQTAPNFSKSALPFKPIPRPAANTGTKLRQNAPQPRDARVDRESMGDFAEFIKSTGPANINEPPPRSSAAMNSRRVANGVTRNASNAGSRSSVASAPLKRSESSANRNKLQARDAAVPRGDSISDLIDFVRSGPQLDQDMHRIPRTVAPFRTTMDSDQMSGAVGGKAVDASLPDPRYSQASASVNSSVTSQSALLSNTSKATKSALPQNRKDFDEEDMMPKRKTRKPRDMYQIDFSDEEEEFEAMTRAKPVAQEESLADFLKNVPPPANSTPAPIFVDNEAASNKKIKKKASSPGLMSRFGRNSTGPQPPPKPKSSSGASATRTPAPQLPAQTPIAAQFSASNSKPSASAYDSKPRGASGANYVAQVDTARNKVAQKQFQPRDAIYTNSRTNDLASFLRDSEPPSALQAQPQTFAPTLQKEEGSAFQRMFGRKKVH